MRSASDANICHERGVCPRTRCGLIWSLPVAPASSPGFFAVLHTWGQALLHHPHLHCVVPGGGVDPEKDRWVPARRLRSGARFFLPVPVLGARFRRLFLEALIESFRKANWSFTALSKAWLYGLTGSSATRPGLTTR